MSHSTFKSEPETRPCSACHHPPSRLRGPTAAITSLSALRQGAESGCFSCSVLSAGIDGVIGDDLPLDGRLQDAVERLRMDMNMTASGQGLNLTLFKRQLEISVFATPPSKTPEFEILFPDVPVGILDLPKSTKSEASFRWVVEKLRQCDNSHGCHRTRSHSIAALPKRILDVGSTDSSLVRLKELDVDDSAETKYACLSHCWGTSQPSKTVTTNLNSHEEEIPWNSLPPVFQDSIAYVRKLGISLLWIDSLCIVQDDKEDWRMEAAKMASIYQNAYIVFSASKSSSSEDGLFGGIDKELNPTIIPIPSSGQGSALCFRKSFTHLPGYMDQKLVKKSPLPTFNRGWIFQERLLAPRVLHFGPQELSWECLEESACQCTGIYSSSSSTGATDTAITMSAQRMLQPKTIYNQDYWKRLDEMKLIKVWHMLVEDYTRLHLTFESDIFPAMSGIAKSFQQHRKSEYAAGMWTKSLLCDLSWHIETISSSSTETAEWHQRPKAWRAPSWSWASALGPIQFLDIGNGMIPLCEIEEIQCIPYQLDPTGELRSSHLLLRGYLISASIQYRPSVLQGSKAPFEVYELEIMRKQVGNVWADYDSSLPGIDHVASGASIKCFMLTTRPDSGSLTLLLLKEVSYDEQNICAVWKRLGLVQLSKPPTVLRDAKEYWFDVFKSQLSDMMLVKII
ncbi:heterokaryon incompatibility domain-containing protein [Trichoderma austrokoningii]